MTSVFGALWTGLQSIGWFLCFLRQLISDTLNINYRLVSTLGHLIAGIAKILYAILSSVVLAVYEFVSHVLLTVAGIFWFVIDCLYFVVHCFTLLLKIIYYTVTGVADGLGFVMLVPICVCQAIHSWIMWIFNMEHWLNVASWCLRTCSSSFSLLGENILWLSQYLATTINCWISVVAAFAYEYVIILCSTIRVGFNTLCARIAGGITFIFFQFWSFILLPLDFVNDCILALQLTPMYRLVHQYTASCSYLIPIVLSLLVMLLFHGRRLTRMLRRYIRHSTGEVIQINFNDMDDVIEVSDDEQDDFRGHVANVLNLADNNQEQDSEVEDTDDESQMVDTSDETSDDTDIGTDSDIDDSDAETIDVQLPDQPTSSLVGGQQHGYATRSKDNASQLQQCLDHERERSLCVICQDQVKSVLVLPCRHMCMCVDCARTMVNGTHGHRRICPLCRGNIRMVMNVYT